MTSSPDNRVTPRWLHWWAVLTVCAAFGLLVLGSLVTTFKAGLADRFWPTHPLFLAREDMIAEAQSQGVAPFLFVIEHSHRAAGWFVGCCSIVLCVGLWLADSRRPIQWLGTAALIGVSLQGVLGGMRVLVHKWIGLDLATLHGCFAQIVFALLASLALFTSSWWLQRQPGEAPGRLARLTFGVSVLVYLQVILGAIVRHSHPRLAQRLHVLLAFVVLGAVFALLTAARDRSREDGRIRWMTRCLSLFLTLQIMLGVEAWMMRFGGYVLPEEVSFTTGNVLVRTLHFVVGSLVFTTTVLLAILVRNSVPRLLPIPATHREPVLEGIA